MLAFSIQVHHRHQNILFYNSTALYVVSLEDLSKEVEVEKIPGSNARPDLSAVAWNPHSQTLAAVSENNFLSHSAYSS